MESQMMAAFGWTDPKMPAHYIAQANREKLGMSGMEKIMAFDQSQSIDEFLQLPDVDSTRTLAGDGVVTFPDSIRKSHNMGLWCARRAVAFVGILMP
jgi:hypothetical protein